MLRPTKTQIRTLLADDPRTLEAIAKGEAEREAALEQLTPNARQRIEAAEQELEREILGLEEDFNAETA